MDEPDSKVMTAKYYEVDEISVLLSSTSHNRSFFHLNISSFTFLFVWWIISINGWKQTQLISWGFLKPILS